MLLYEYAERILSKSFLDYYLSSSFDGGRIEWPLRFFPPGETYERYVNLSDTFIVDSAFNKAEVTNKDVLDCAFTHGADMVVLEDVYQDFENTVRRVLEGMETADDHEFGGEVICPLQAPFEECYRELGEPDWVAIGGLKDAKETRKITAARQLRRIAGDDTYIHGLGWGASDQLIAAVRENPELLDSIDAQTEGIEANVMDVWPGAEQSTPKAAFILGRMLEKCRRMSPIPDEPNKRTESAKLTEFATQ